MRVALAAFLPLAALSTLAHADTFPSGNYILAAESYTTGVHTSAPAVITGSLVFNPGGILASASLTLTDLTTGFLTTFTSVGGTDFIPQYHIQDTSISNALNSNYSFLLSFADLPNAFGAYTDLTCGTDCHDFASTALGYYEFHGVVAPAPEPSTLALLGTGALSAFGIARRRLL